MADPSSAHPSNDELDPVYRHTRAEAVIILIVWAACLVWTVGYCTTHGYAEPDGPIDTVLGMPAWIFWGVLTPWATATVFSIVFALCFIKDDDLGEDLAEAESPADPASHSDSDAPDEADNASADAEGDHLA